MEDEESKAPKRQKIESKGELVKAKSNKKKQKFKGPAFEIQEYDFSEIGEGSSDNSNLEMTCMINIGKIRIFLQNNL